MKTSGTEPSESGSASQSTTVGGSSSPSKPRDRCGSDPDDQPGGDGHAQQADLLTAILAVSGDPIYVIGRDGRYIRVSDSGARAIGLTPGQVVGRHWREINLPADLMEPVDAQREAALETGQATRHETDFVTPDGLRHFEYVITPIAGDDGRRDAVVVVSRDVTERQRRERVSRFLADASAELAAVVDCEATLRKVARLAVPFFADWCAVYMEGEEGTLRNVAAVHADPTKTELAEDFHRRYPPQPGSPGGVYDVFRTGRSSLVAEISAPMLEAAGRDDEHRRMLRELGLASYIGVPMATRERTLGVITFIHAESGRRYTDADLALAEDLAHRAAVAVENARLYEEQRAAEQELAGSQERLRLALEAGRMGTWEWDVLTNAVHWSPGLEAIHGLEPGTFPGTFEAYQNDMHPNDRERVSASIREAVQAGTEHHVEYRIVLPDGRLRWVEAGGRVFRDEAGRPQRMLGVCQDVTDRKRIEEQLHEESRIAETVHRLGSALLAELDLDRLVQILTDEATALIRAAVGAFFYNVVAEDGESYTLYSLSGAPRERFQDFPMPRATAVFEPTFRGQCVVRLDDVTADPRFGKNAPYYGMPDGHLPVRSYLAAPVVSRSGDVLGGLFFGHPEVGVFTERDERLVVGLAAHAAIAIDNASLYRATQESELRLQQLADSMPQAVWAARPDGVLDYFNRRWYEYYGDPDGAAVGDESWIPVLHPDDVQRTLDRWYAAVRTGEPYEIEYRFKERQTGSYRWHLGRALPVRGAAGEIVRWYGTSTDIEDQKRAEQVSRFLAEAGAELAKLMDSESTLQRVASLAVPDFADWCAVDLVEDGRLRRVAVTHVEPEKVELAFRLYQEYPPDPDSPYGAPHILRTGRPELIETIPESLLEEAARDERHLSILRELGLRSYVGVPLIVQGEVLGVLTFVLAESGRHYGPRDLTLAEDLARRAAVAIDNARLYAELREADHRKNEFLAMLAHELRNPLAPIRSGLDLLALERGETEATALMQEQVEHLVRLVDDLLDVSRIMRGKVRLRLEPVDAASVLQRAVDMARPVIAAHGHRLHLMPPDWPDGPDGSPDESPDESSGGPLWVRADTVRLAQVVTNLLNNAAKYTNRGGNIWLTVGRAGDDVAFSVRDDGIGIEADLLPRVFDLFTQADRSLDRSQGGLGIGLTLVRTLVEMHGGTVVARSDGLGHGSEFVVRLPSLEHAPRPASSAPAVDQGTPRRILAVDDTPAAAKMLKLLLTKMGGHEVRLAHDGPSALSAAEEFRPEVVFLDIGLPKLDGYEVARRLRQRPEFADTLLIALTGYGQEEDRRKSSEAGFDVHLVKPPSLDDIRHALAHPKLKLGGRP